MKLSKGCTSWRRYSINWTMERSGTFSSKTTGNCPNFGEISVAVKASNVNLNDPSASG
jgi:hypothetical protein